MNPIISTNPMQRAREAIANSRKNAKALNCLGMEVIVTMSDVLEVQTTIRQLPWALGHGAMVVGVEGIAGGYDCNRVRPKEKTPPSRRCDHKFVDSNHCLKCGVPYEALEKGTAK